MTEAEWDAVDPRAPQGPLLPDPPRRGLLARAGEGGQGGQGGDRPHDVDVRAVRQPGPGQLRRREGGHRHVLAGVREGARPVRRALERDRAGRAHAAHRGDARPRRHREGARGRASTCGIPANVSPFVAYLATAECPFTGEAFFVQGGMVRRVQSWAFAEKIDKGDRWTVDELADKLSPKK